MGLGLGSGLGLGLKRAQDEPRPARPLPEVSRAAAAAAQPAAAEERRVVVAAEAAWEAAVVARGAARERVAARGLGGRGWETRAAAAEEALEGGTPEVNALSSWLQAACGR